MRYSQRRRRDRDHAVPSIADYLKREHDAVAIYDPSHGTITLRRSPDVSPGEVRYPIDDHFVAEIRGR